MKEKVLKPYDLLIVYPNGEIDSYYHRLTGDYWWSEYDSTFDVIKEMRIIDLETFLELEDNFINDQISYYSVVKIEGLKNEKLVCC